MSYSSEVLADSPAAYYRCQEASGLIQDSSGNARHATASAGTAQYQQTGPIPSDGSDKAIYFDGDASFNVPDVGLDLGDTLSLEFWIKRTTTGIDECVISKGSLGYDCFFKAADNKLYFDKAGDIDIANSTVAITDTGWHHCVITKNGTGANCAIIYIDGTGGTNLLFDSIAIEDTAIELYIGQSAFGGSLCNSYLDEIAIYDTVLSAARVQAHYDAAAPVASTPLRTVRSALRW